ncbi:hypothetical protein OIU85_003136 [Salix viminalis]|uniref:FAS1 domain-containing protein n=1 Tax=Salix viminalis TaxID=40686 RepID=A0A9Q0T0D3_SALVM|nr:hypothetical protein OIU85_003136 [Salix viminalis]
MPILSTKLTPLPEHHNGNLSPLSPTPLTLPLPLSPCSSSGPGSACSGAPSGPVNFTAVLEKGGQFVTFMMLLNKTQTFNQVENQLNSSSEGMTIFAPTDNAFSNLKAGALNGLSQQQQVQLLQYHMLSKFYSLSNLLLVSNPVSTQASGHEGVWGLNFTGQSNQVNVSTGLVEVQINNALRQDFPLAVYPIDKVLLPEELFGVNRTIASPPPPPTSSGKSNSSETAAAEPSPGQELSWWKECSVGVDCWAWFGLHGNNFLRNYVSKEVFPKFVFLFLCDSSISHTELINWRFHVRLLYCSSLELISPFV